MHTDHDNGKLEMPTLWNYLYVGTRKIWEGIYYFGFFDFNEFCTFLLTDDYLLLIYLWLLDILIKIILTASFC